MTSAVSLVRFFFPFVFPCSGRTAHEIWMEISGGSLNKSPKAPDLEPDQVSGSEYHWYNYFEPKKPSSIAQTQILKCLLCEQWMWTMSKNILLLKWLLYHHSFEDSHYFSVIYNVLHAAMPDNCSAKSGKEG